VTGGIAAFSRTSVSKSTETEHLSDEGIVMSLIGTNQSSARTAPPPRFDDLQVSAAIHKPESTVHLSALASVLGLSARDLLQANPQLTLDSRGYVEAGQRFNLPGAPHAGSATQTAAFGGLVPSREEIAAAAKAVGRGVADAAQQTAQQSVEAAAKFSINQTLAQPSTSAAAREVLTAFLTGEGPRKFEYGMGSQGLAELLGRDDPGGYYKREIAGALTYMMSSEKYNRPYLKNGDGLEKHTLRHFDKDIKAMAGLSNGVQLGDAVGTMSSGWKVEVKNDRIYFIAHNKMDLTSFAAGNLLSRIGVNDYIVSPKSGLLSPVEMIFKFDIAIPPALNAPKQP
jgi:hypothetical protein